MSDGDEIDKKRLVRQRIRHSQVRYNNQGLVQHTLFRLHGVEIETLESLRDILKKKLDVIQAKNETIEQEEFEDKII